MGVVEFAYYEQFRLPFLRNSIPLYLRNSFSLLIPPIMEKTLLMFKQCTFVKEPWFLYKLAIFDMLLGFVQPFLCNIQKFQKLKFVRPERCLWIQRWVRLKYRETRLSMLIVSLKQLSRVRYLIFVFKCKLLGSCVCLEVALSESW